MTRRSSTATGRTASRAGTSASPRTAAAARPRSAASSRATAASTGRARACTSRASRERSRRAGRRACRAPSAWRSRSRTAAARQCCTRGRSSRRSAGSRSITSSARTPSLGDYYVRAKLGDQVFREKFSVEEFRPASFELALRSTTAQPRPGRDLAFQLDASTCSARRWATRRSVAPPQAHAPARVPGLRATRSRAIRACGGGAEDDDDYGEYVSEGEGTTDAQGRLAITARDEVSSCQEVRRPDRLHPVGERHRRRRIRRWASRSS